MNTRDFVNGLMVDPESTGFVACARYLSVIQRWAVVRTIQNQSVAEHSFNVAILCRALCEVAMRDEQIMTNSVFMALTHDLEECIEGDRPTPLKGSKNYSKIAKGGEEYIIVKIADLLDQVLFLQTEISLGNILVRKTMASAITELTLAKEAWTLNDVARNRVDKFVYRSMNKIEEMETPMQAYLRSESE